MGIAQAVRRRANCMGSHVGAVLVLNDRVISTGTNGTPQGMLNCEDGGCVRCKNRDEFGHGEGYDKCICVHAEQNALLTAARFGIAVEHAALYTTLKPCFSCAKALLQAGVHRLYFQGEWGPREPQLKEQYEVILARFESVEHIDTVDPWLDNS